MLGETGKSPREAWPAAAIRQQGPVPDHTCSCGVRMADAPRGQAPSVRQRCHRTRAGPRASQNESLNGIPTRHVPFPPSPRTKQPPAAASAGPLPRGCGTENESINPRVDAGQSVSQMLRGLAQKINVNKTKAWSPPFFPGAPSTLYLYISLHAPRFPLSGGLGTASRGPPRPVRTSAARPRQPRAPPRRRAAQRPPGWALA